MSKTIRCSCGGQYDVRDDATEAAAKCIWCGAWNAIPGARLIASSGSEEAWQGDWMDPAERRKLWRELTSANIALGVILLLFATLNMTLLASAGAPPLGGMRRDWAIGLPLISLGVWHLMCGVCLRLFDMSLFAVLGSIGATVFAICPIALLVSTGQNPINLLNGLIALMAGMFWVKSLRLSAARPVVSEPSGDSNPTHGDSRPRKEP